MAVFTTKTYFDCIDKAAELATSFGVSLDTKIIIFCEDKLTLSLEKALVTKAGGAFGAEVLSFGRYVSRINPDRKTLSKESSAMAVKKILNDLKGQLTSFSRLGASPSLATKTSELIAQLKSAKVTPDSLFNCLEDCPKNMGAKLHDIALVFKGYEEFLKKGGFTDSSNSLDDMIPAIKSDEDLRGAHVIIAGYSSITKQSCEVMETLLSICASCDFIAVSGENEDLYTNEFLNFALRITGEKEIKEKSSACEEANRILDRIFKPEGFEGGGIPSKKVRFFEAKNLADEVDYVCAQIKNLVTCGGYRYQDLAVGVGQIADYQLLLERKLLDYEIPFFTDKKRNLASHPVARLSACAIKAAIKKDLNEIKKVITSSLFISEKPLADRLIRLIVENSVTATTFLAGEDFIPDSEDGLLNLENTLLRQRIDLLVGFINGFPRSGEAKTFVDALSKFIKSATGYVENGEQNTTSNFSILSKNLQDLSAKEDDSFLHSGMKNYFTVLEEIKDILGDERLTADEFLKLLTSGEEASEISLIPEFLDCVYVSEIKNLRYKKYSNIFVMGLSGDIPVVKTDTALLLDSDISTLDKLNVPIEPKIRVVNKREKEATAIALASFEDCLYLSYSLTSPSGKAIPRSEIIDYILDVFSEKSGDKLIKPTILTRNSFFKDSEEAEKNERLAFSYLGLRPALLSLLSEGDDYKNGAITSLDGASAFYDALKKIEGGKHLETADYLLGAINKTYPFHAKFPITNYFNKRNVSATTVETFFSCPYKCFLKFGVGLKDTISSEIKALDFGNMLHNVCEFFMPCLKDMTCEQDCEKKADELMEEELKKPKYARFLKRADSAYSSYLTKIEARKLCVELYRQSKQTKFVTEGSEIWFADWKDTPYKSINLNSKEGSYKLHGKADRLDRYDSGTVSYVRIIDYKTGNAKSKSDVGNFYYGQNLQLYLYLNAFTANGSEPAGAYYYGVNNDFEKEGSSPTLMYGQTLDDDEIIEATDTSLSSINEGASGIVEISKKRTKDGVKTSGNLADKTTVKSFMKYAKYLTESAINNVIDGVIVPSPCEGACSYCEFGSICEWESFNGAKLRKTNKVKGSTIVSAVDEIEKKEKGGTTDGKQ